MLNLKYQKKFKAQDSGTVCPLPTAGQTSVTCLTGPVGAPTAITSKLVSVEFRQRFDDFAVAAIVTRDFSQKITGVELPVYFVADKDGKLTAGLKVGWRSDKDQATFGLFVGIPFALFD